jgi:hypothetical protein
VIEAEAAIKLMRFDQPFVAGHFDQHAPRLAQPLFGGVDQRAANAPAAIVSRDLQDRDPSDRLRPMDGRHDV